VKTILYTRHEMEMTSEHSRLSGREMVKLGWQFQKYLLPFWDKVLLNIIMGTVGQVYGMFYPLMSALFIDVAIPQKDVPLFWMVVISLAFFGAFLRPGVLSLIGTLTASTCNWYIHITLGYRLRLMFYKHLHSLSMRFFQRRPIGEHMFRAQADVGGAIALIVRPIPSLLNILFGGFVMVGIAFTHLPWWVILSQYSYMLTYWTVFHWVRTVQRRMSHVRREKSQAVSAGMQDGLAGFQTVKAFGRGRTEVKKFLNLLHIQIRQSLKIFWFGFLVRHITGNRPPGLSWAHSLVVGLSTGIMIIQGDLTLGDRILIISYLGWLSGPFQRIFGLFQLIRLWMISAERLHDTLAVRPAVEVPKNGVRLKPLKGHIVFDNVSFRYDEDEEVLKNISFEIQPGTSLGIVGPSGAGKTTLLSILTRLYDPTGGQVRIDGHDLKDLNLEDYHHQIGPVLQETFLFQGTLRDNLQFSLPGASDKEILDALERAEVSDFLHELADGLDTDLSEGSRIAGGQKQRIGIARAILRDPAMMILDEPTSSLDIPTEHAVVNTLEAAIEDRTAIFVSHRLGLVSGCDTIIVMDRGELVAQGTHEELLKSCDLYRDLWEEQFGESNTSKES